MLDKLFVYGTLMRGYDNHHVLQPHTKFSECVSLKGFILLNIGKYPAILPSDEDATVQGELYWLEDVKQGLQQTDRLEGHPFPYHRQTVTVTTANGDWVEAWAYVWTSNPIYPVIESGDYRQFNPPTATNEV